MDPLNALVALLNVVIIPATAHGAQLALGVLGVTLVYGILRVSTAACGGTRATRSHGHLAALCLMALPMGAAAQDAFDCTVTTTCDSADACTPGGGPLRLMISADGALVTQQEGQEIGFDRPVTRRENGPVLAFAAVTPLDTTLLLTFDRTSPEGTDSRLMITEHGRDADGAQIVSLIATCRPEEG